MTFWFTRSATYAPKHLISGLVLFQNISKVVLGKYLNCKMMFIICQYSDLF